MSSPLVNYIYDLIKSDCVFGISDQQMLQSVFSRDMSVQWLIEQCQPRDEFYEYVAEIIIRFREYELAGMCVICIAMDGAGGGQWLLPCLHKYAFKLLPKTNTLIGKLMEQQKHKTHSQQKISARERPLEENNDVFEIIR